MQLGRHRVCPIVRINQIHISSRDKKLNLVNSFVTRAASKNSLAHQGKNDSDLEQQCSVLATVHTRMSCIKYPDKTHREAEGLG